MEKIYVNNYKGFKEQFIELADVNFFVGENSTGKTSILKIVNLLSSDKFWFDFEFNNDEVELGYFEEIISKNINEKFFHIALEKSLKNDSDKEVEEKVRVLLEFNKFDSVPSIDKIKITFGTYDVYIKISAKEIKYKTKEITKKTFDEWVKDLSFPSSFKKIDFPSVKIPFPLILDFVFQEIKKKTSNRPLKRRKFNQEKLYDRLNWIAPIRAKPKRLYESYKMNFSAEGDHVPQILRKILSSSSLKNQKKIISTLEKFGAESNLFDKIQVNELGKKNSSPFEINVKYKNTEVKLPNVGYGVSQSLPIIIEVLANSDSFFTIQQPEVHLHPRAQAAFGSFLFNSVINDRNKFIIETHSDFTINRFRYELMKSEAEIEVNSKVLFFERTENGNLVTSIEIKPNGNYEIDIPDSYRDFFIDEELKLLEI